jgi:hypothetical protein
MIICFIIIFKSQLSHRNLSSIYKVCVNVLQSFCTLSVWFLFNFTNLNNRLALMFLPRIVLWKYLSRFKYHNLLLLMYIVLVYREIILFICYCLRPNRVRFIIKLRRTLTAPIRLLKVITKQVTTSYY